MTLDQFLDEYVPNVLKPMGGWRLSSMPGASYAYVRAERDPATWCCPLTAAAGDPCDHWKHDGLALGLTLEDCYAVITAADGESFYGEPVNHRTFEIRARLLAGLGLAEGK